MRRAVLTEPFVVDAAGAMSGGIGGHDAALLAQNRWVRIGVGVGRGRQPSTPGRAGRFDDGLPGNDGCVPVADLIPVVELVETIPLGYAALRHQVGAPDRTNQAPSNHAPTNHAPSNQAPSNQAPSN